MSLRDEQKDRRKLAQRLSAVLRKLAEGKRSKHETILLDLACNLDTTGVVTDLLPMEPTGFTVKHATALKHKNVSAKILCEMQVVTMAVMYYRLYRMTGDTQDARSCSRYCGWLEDYAASSRLARIRRR
jgi:hypothetical protein